MTRLAKKSRSELRGQLMLQISAGRFFRPSVELNEHTHRRTLYTNVWFADPKPIELPVGTLVGSTERNDVTTVLLEAKDRLEAQTWGGANEFLVATSGDELMDDIAYVMTFALNRTFSRRHDQVHRLVAPEGLPPRHHNASRLIPKLFDPAQIVRDSDWMAVTDFMTDLLALQREDFARVLRVIRNTVDATRTAIDDPTGAYTDLVAALESLGERGLTATSSTWDRYDSRKRKIVDAALEEVDPEVASRIKVAILQAERSGLKRRFITSTISRVSPAYYRDEAVGAVRPPRAADLERMLSIAYDIRSRRSHVLEDLGDEAWTFTDGAETTFEGNFERILTLAGLWRLTRHVVHRFVGDAPRVEPEPWDYRGALPGQIMAQLAPRYWIGHAVGFNATSAPRWFNGATEAMISWLSGDKEGFDLTNVCREIERLAPPLPASDAKTTMIALYVLWHEWLRPEEHGSRAQEFIEEHESCLDLPTPVAFAVGLLSNRELPAWTIDEWATMASTRQNARNAGKEAPLPPAIDTLLQVEAADQLEAGGRHEEAVLFAANAVEGSPGDESLIDWEKKLLSGAHDPNFSVHRFLFGGSGDANPNNGDAEALDG